MKLKRLISIKDEPKAVRLFIEEWKKRFYPNEEENMADFLDYVQCLELRIFLRFYRTSDLISSRWYDHLIESSDSVLAWNGEMPDEPINTYLYEISEAIKHLLTARALVKRK